MSSFVSNIFKWFPEGGVKNYIRCFFYNRVQKEFRISFRNNLFFVEKDGFLMKFFDNPYHQFLTDKDYFHRFTLKPGDILVDAGAFRGMLSIYASRLVGDNGLVIAMEPDPDQYERLIKNIEINGVKNIKVIKKGLWGESTVLSFKSGNELASSFIDADSQNTTLRVEVTTLDAVFESITPKGAVLVKMNIEGSEIEAVKGAKETISKYKPGFVIRTNHWVDGKTTDGPVEELLRNYGYQPETKQLHEQTTFA